MCRRNTSGRSWRWSLVLLVFYFSDRTYAFLEKFFKVIMVGNIVLVLLITGMIARPQHYWTCS